jgi:hypothetical protein
MLGKLAGKRSRCRFESNLGGQIYIALLQADLPGTHRGHNKVFLAVPRTPSSASVFL